MIRALNYSQAGVSLQSFDETRGQSKKSVIFVQFTLIQFVLQNENPAPLQAHHQEVRVNRRPKPEAQERIGQSDVQNTDVLLM